MPPAPLILRHPTRTTGRIASVSAEPTGDGRFLVRLGVGDHFDRLNLAKVLGPLDAVDVPAAFDGLVAELRADGYGSNPIGAASSAINDLAATPRDPRRRAMAAGRLCWLAAPAACDPLLAALAEANEEACCILDALGRCGDARAVPAVAEQAARKLLSRRRSAVEALIHLGDPAALDAARLRVIDELPDNLVAAADAGNPAAALAALEPKRQGQAADYLYEYAGVGAKPAAAEAAVRWVESLPTLGEPFEWRYVKSLFKRAELRRDPAAFGRLARLLDLAKARPRTVTLKSGLTGQPQQTTVFRGATRDYLRRRAWRHLRRLAEHEPERYAPHAAALLAAYKPADAAALARKADQYHWSGSYGIGPWGRSYLIGHAFHGGDPTVQWKGMKWSTATHRAKQGAKRAGGGSASSTRVLPASAEPGQSPFAIWQRLRGWLTGGATPPAAGSGTAAPTANNEPPPAPGFRPEGFAEAYPRLWDRAPNSYLTLLAFGRVEAFVRFALDAVTARHPDLAAEASSDQLLGMLDSLLPAVVELSAVELRRRLAADEPPWELVRRLADDARQEAREVAYEVLRRRPAAWAVNPDRAAAILLSTQPATADAAAAVMIDFLPSTDPAVRRAMAARLLAILRDPPPPPPTEVSVEVPVEESAPVVAEESAEEADAVLGGAEDSRLDAIARVVAESLAAEADELAGPTAALMDLFDGPTSAARVAAAVLARRSDAADSLGLDNLLQLAEHDLAAVRAAASRVLADAPRLWESDPMPLLNVAEGRWPDARAALLDMLLNRVMLDRLGPDNLLALLDSTLPDVRRAAVAAVDKGPSTLDRAGLAARLAEHPARGMRLYALDLAADALPAGAGALEKLRPLLSASLLDATPSRPLKRRVFAALIDCGTADDAAARLAAEVLRPITRSAVAHDAESAVVALARIRLARPEAFDSDAADLQFAAIGGAA